MKRISLVLIFSIIPLVLFACSGIDEGVSEPSASPVIEDTEPGPTPITVETATAALASLSAQPYSHPSGAYKIFFPQNWNCSESGLYRVDCQSPDQEAAISVRLITTGVRLTQPEFLNLAQAEINYAHVDQRAFNEVDRSIGDGTLLVQSTWFSGEVSVLGWDYFARSDEVVIHLAFSAAEERWDNFEGLFNQVREGFELFPVAVLSNPIYSSTFSYTSPDSLFLIEIPTSWTKFLDVSRILNTQIEQFFSPDRHASIQTVIYRHGALIEQEFKATKTLEILRTIYGTGFRVSHDKALPDGRERLVWNVEPKKLSGISFFDSWGGSLYIFTVLWDDEYQELYQPVLDRVVESFAYP